MPITDPEAWKRVAHGDVDAWIDFLGHHDLQHRQFGDAIRRLGGAPYARLPLGSPRSATWLTGALAVSVYPDENWHEIHQATHQGEDAALAIAGPSDFRSYDLNSPEEFATWVWIHALEHIRVRQAIGV